MVFHWSLRDIIIIIIIIIILLLLLLLLLSVTHKSFSHQR